jgi:hypothetical protein
MNKISKNDWAITEIKNICVNFIWNNGAHLVKYNTIICEKSKGGLQLPDIKSKLIAFRLKFLAFHKIVFPDINISELQNNG